MNSTGPHPGLLGPQPQKGLLDFTSWDLARGLVRNGRFTAGDGQRFADHPDAVAFVLFQHGLGEQRGDELVSFARWVPEVWIDQARLRPGPASCGALPTGRLISVEEGAAV